MTRRCRHYLYMVVVPITFFLLLDLVLRLAGIDPYQEKPLSPAASLAFKKLYKKGALPGNRPGYVPTVTYGDPYLFQPIPSQKTTDTISAFVTGGSVPSGFPFSGSVAFPQWLKAGIEAVYPGKTVHVVNAAIPGIPLNTVSDAVGEMLDYQPDVFVIYSGNNEYRNLREGITVFKNTDIGPTLLRACWKLRSFQILHYLIIGKRPSFNWKFGRKKHTPYEADEFSYLLERYGTGLQKIYEKAARANVPLVFCTIPVNEKDWPPYESVHSIHLRQDEHEKWRKDLRYARDLIQSNRPKAARKVCEKLVAKDNHYALAHFLMGKALEQAGQYDRAKTSFQLALDLDRTRMRAFGALNRTLVDFCSKQSIPIADCATSLRSHADHGLLGYDQFMDNCHLKPSAHRAISKEIARAIMKTGVLPPPPMDWQAQFDNGLVRYKKQLIISEKEFALACLNTAKALLEGITFRMDLQALNRAESLLVQALNADPRICSGHFYLGVVYFLKGNVEQARIEWEAELDICPRFSATRMTLDMLASGRLQKNMLLQKKVFNLDCPAGQAEATEKPAPAASPR